MSLTDWPVGTQLVLRVSPAPRSRYSGGNFAQGYPFLPNSWPSSNSVRIYNPRLESRRPLLFERENAIPIVSHTDDGPALRHGSIVQRLRERADATVWQTSCWTIGIFPDCIIMQQ